MPRRTIEPPRYPPGWVESLEIVVNGRHVRPGVEVKISGEKGRFRFVKHVANVDQGVEWVDVWGGPKSSPALRSFRPDRIVRVHRIKQTPEGLLEARLSERSSS